MTVHRKLRPSELLPTKLVASFGDSVTLKVSASPALAKYKDLVGTWQGQVGDFSHVSFPGHGTVTVPSADLIVM